MTSAVEPESAVLGLARELVLTYGRNANAYQILNPGFSLWFSDARDAAVGYVRHRNFLVAAGAPVCADEKRPEVLAEFDAFAKSRSLRVCWFGSEAPMAAYFAASPRHSLLRLGAQPSWDPAEWEAGVAAHASLRAQLHRARNKGVSASEMGVVEAGRDPSLQRCLDEWLATRGAPAMHFLVEPRTLERLFDRRLFVARRGGDLVGFLVASPVPRRRGWLVEQIIRGRGAANGTSELLVDAAMRGLAATGSSWVTLGLSPLSTRSLVGSTPTPLWLRALLGWVRAHGRRFYNFEGLDSFKAKLRPGVWEPVYAIADAPSFPPSALHAIAGAFTSGSPEAAVVRALAWALRQEASRLLNR